MYRWRALPRIHRHWASKSQGSSERVLPWQVTMDQLICTSLSHTHYWYEEGMLNLLGCEELVSHLILQPKLLNCVSRAWTCTILRSLRVSSRPDRQLKGRFSTYLLLTSLYDLRLCIAASIFRRTTVFGLFWIMLKTSDLPVALFAFFKSLTQTFWFYRYIYL